jgi:WD40 repeat protein
VTSVAYSFDGSRLFAGGYSGAIRSWQVDEAGRLTPAEPLQGHARQVTCLVASPAAKFIASGSAGGELKWQSYANSAQPPRSLAALKRGVLAIHLPLDRLDGLATDGRQLVQFDLRNGDVIRSIDLQRGVPQGAAFSRDGTQLAVADGRKIRLCNTETGEEVATLTAADTQWNVEYLPSGKGLISGGHGKATLWRLPAGEPVAQVDLGGKFYIQTLAISADSKLLAAIPSAAGQDLTVVRLPESP